MEEEHILDRLKRLVDEAVRAGRFKSRTAFLTAAGMSSGYFGEGSSRKSGTLKKRKSPASMNVETVKKCAELLGVAVVSIISPEQTDSDVPVDKYEGRAFAIAAARKLKFPEAAIQLVLKEDPGTDLGAMYWFRRLETERERVRPTAEL
jgi:hypothetical protein